MTPTAPTETADEAQQAGADAYTSAAAEIATLDADDQSILYTPLFTYAANPDANKTISFGNYLAALYAEIVTNEPGHGAAGGCVRRGVRGRCDRAGIRRDHPRI